MSRDSVIIARSSFDNLPGILRNGINEIGLPDLAHRCIGIKPNLCSSKSPRCGATTDVEIVRQLIEILNDHTSGSCKILVLESNAEGISADYAFKRLGYHELEDTFSNVELVNLSKGGRINVTFSRGRILDLLEVSERLLEVEYLINVAKLKTHVDERMSCCLKNQFGLISRKRKSFFHPVLSETLCDLNSMFSSDLCIVNGIFSMEGFGPTDGMPKNVGAILIGSNPIATDIVAAKIMGFRPRQIPHLRLAMKANRYRESSFSLKGEDLESVCSPFQFIPFRHYLTARLGLKLQKLGLYATNLGAFLQKVRSALVMVGFDEINSKVSLKDMVVIAARMVFKVSG